MSNSLNKLLCRSYLNQSKRFQVTMQASPILNDINHNLLRIETTKKFKKLPDKKTLEFGATWSDHMIEIDWDKDYGWHEPIIKPFGPLQISPASTSLQYALQCFDGFKAYLDDQNRIRLFRADRNMDRLLGSCEALHFPTFDVPEFMECLYELLTMEKRWIPTAEDLPYSLYVRPTVISTYGNIGVAPAKTVKLYVILSPVGPYYPEGFNPISLLADAKYVRAWPGGVGSKKVGSNYGPTVRPAKEAANRGYSQIMWLFPDGKDGEDYVSEVGTMNQFFFWINKNGERELITAPLDGTILTGVTRESVLDLVREWGEFKVTERPFTMKEVCEAVDENRMIESFGAGTAAVVSPVNKIWYKGKDYIIQLDKSNPDAKAGPLAQKLFDSILDIQYGRVEHKWSVVVPEKIAKTK